MTVKIDGNGPVTGASFGPMGQCLLVKSGTPLVLLPYRGSKVTINGAAYDIPAAGVSLAPTGAAVNTTYLIYLLQTAGVLSMEYSTTAHATDTSTANGNQGAEIKAGDAARTLVGQARTDAAGAWIDTAASRFVLSWFNRRPIVAQGVFSVDRTTGGAEGSYTELNAEIRANFLSWAGDNVVAEIEGIISNNGAATNVITGIGFDSTTVPLRLSQIGSAVAAGSAWPLSVKLPKSDLAEGVHYATLIQRSAGANSVNYFGAGTDPLRATRCMVTIQG